MRATDLGELQCPIARTIGVVGDARSLMIIRELFLGSRRFDQFEAQLRAPPALLTKRLKALEDAGIISRRPYQSSPLRYEYHLTRKGVDLWPVMIGLKEWGDKWGGWADQPPAQLRHGTCGGLARMEVRCDSCDQVVTAFDAELKQLEPMASERATLTSLKRERDRDKAMKRRKSAK